VQLTCTDTKEPVISMSVDEAYTVFVSQVMFFLMINVG